MVKIIVRTLIFYALQFAAPSIVLENALKSAWQLKLAINKVIKIFLQRLRSCLGRYVKFNVFYNRYENFSIH